MITLIEEDNRLIAEFMGLIRSDEPVGGLGHQKYWWFHKRPFLWDDRVCSDDELCYHLSWDWLIPVVQRINGKIGSKLVIDALITLDINIVYNEVVKYIKFWNAIDNNER